MILMFTTQVQVRRQSWFEQILGLVSNTVLNQHCHCHHSLIPAIARINKTVTEIWRWKSTAEDSPSCESMDDDDDEGDYNSDYDTTDDKGKGKGGKGNVKGKGKTDKADKDTSVKKRKADDTNAMTSHGIHKGSSTDQKPKKK